MIARVCTYLQKKRIFRVQHKRSINNKPQDSVLRANSINHESIVR